MIHPGEIKASISWYLWSCPLLPNQLPVAQNANYSLCHSPSQKIEGVFLAFDEENYYFGEAGAGTLKERREECPVMIKYSLNSPAISVRK